MFVARFIIVVLLGGLILTSSSPCNGQTTIPYHYRIGEADFENVNVYSLFFDEEEKVLYAGTNCGIYYYSQSKFHKIKVDKGAIGTSFFNLQKDSKGNLFASNYKGQIFMFSKEKIELFYEFPYEQIHHNFDYILKDNDNIICVADQVIELKRKGNRIIDSQILINHSRTVNRIKQLKSGKFLLGISENNLEIFKRKNPNLDSIFILGHGRRVFELDGTPITSEGIIKPNNFFYLNGYTDGGELKFKHKLNFNEEYPFPLTDTSFLLIGRKNGLVPVSYKNDKLYESYKLFNNEFISTAYQSNNGVLFLGTFKNGVIVVPIQNIFGHISTDIFTSISVYNKDNYIAAKRNGEIYAYSFKNRSENLIKYHSEKFDYLHVINSDTLQKWDNILFSDLNFLKATNLGKEKVAVIYWNNVRLVHKNKDSNFSQIKMKDGLLLNNGRYQSIAADTVNQSIYISDYKNLFKWNYNGELIEKIKCSFPFFVTNLIFQDGILFCSTKSNGVLLFKNDKLIQQIKGQNGLKSSSIIKVKKMKDLLYILTAEGIQIYNLATNKLEDTSISLKLIDKNIIDFDVSEENILVLRKKDHYVIPLPFKSDSFLPSKIDLDSMVVKKKVTPLSKNSFSHLENSITFYVDYRNMMTKERTEIQYKLVGFYDSWRSLKKGDHKIEFQSLPKGEYMLKVRAKFQEKLSDEFNYSFVISPPFWQRWWFYLLISLITASLIGVYAFSRLRNIRKKNAQALEVETNRRIAVNAQLKAIRAQMNPHFIFNSINSIQDLVLQKETLKSYDYLESFSRLVRMTLDHSEREFVPLHEEVEFLQLYLELESLRFDNNFTFKLVYTKESNQVIPSLIIQPFVENAIKHGLLHKHGNKYLYISFKMLNSNIECIIEDNGIGRMENKRIMKRSGKTHVSFSTNAIKNRMEMLSNQIGLNCSYEIEDLYSKDKKALGTRIKINLPIIGETVDK